MIAAGESMRVGAARTAKSKPIRLAAVAACAVPYQVPLYRLLAADSRVDLTVFYGSTAVARTYRDVGFGNREVEGDPSLLEGYHCRFLRRAERCAPDRGFFALANPEVVTVLRRGRFDALWVHGFSHLTMWLAIAAAAAAGIPVLLREEQTLLHRRRGPKAAVRATVLRGLFGHVYGLYIGSNNRAFFRHYGVPEERLFPAPYCVDNEALQLEADALQSRRDELRRRFGIPEDSPVILFVGRLSPKKDPELLLEAFKRVRKRHTCSLILVGDGELRDQLKTLAGSTPDVHLAGLRTGRELSEAYVAADIFVLPSNRHETWGLVVNEAMNYSLPVVVSDKVGCAADLVHPGENGLIFPAGDLDGLFAALASLVSDPNRRQQLGKRSRELVTGQNYRVAVDGILSACTAANAKLNY